MIVLNLCCSNRHAFEGWFASLAAFRDQAEDGQVACPHCNSTSIEKLPAGPHVRRSLTETPVVPALQLNADEVKLRKLMEEMLRHSDDVGARFPEEARKIHYSEIPPRSIYGTASAAEVISLLEEDIGVIPLPKILRNDVH
ncbi:MAG: DUF1178 family protein [Rhodocyclaceae bacterium]|nr:MAG: DUF1178 family protein [Rhodocyclaceae bacterium]